MCRCSLMRLQAMCYRDFWGDRFSGNLRLPQVEPQTAQKPGLLGWSGKPATTSVLQGVRVCCFHVHVNLSRLVSTTFPLVASRCVVPSFLSCIRVDPKVYLQ